MPTGAVGIPLRRRFLDLCRRPSAYCFIPVVPSPVSVKRPPASLQSSLMPSIPTKSAESRPGRGRARPTSTPARGLEKSVDLIVVEPATVYSDGKCGEVVGPTVSEPTAIYDQCLPRCRDRCYANELRASSPARRQCRPTRWDSTRQRQTATGVRVGRVHEPCMHA